MVCLQHLGDWMGPWCGWGERFPCGVYEACVGWGCDYWGVSRGWTLWKDEWAVCLQPLSSSHSTCPAPALPYPALPYCAHSPPCPSASRAAPLPAASSLQVPSADKVLKDAAAQGMNLRKLDATTVGISLDETTKLADVDALLKVGVWPVGACMGLCGCGCGCIAWLLLVGALCRAQAGLLACLMTGSESHCACSCCCNDTVSTCRNCFHATWCMRIPSPQPLLPMTCLLPPADGHHACVNPTRLWTACVPGAEWRQGGGLPGG